MHFLPKLYKGIIHIPASKSDAQRALLIASLSNKSVQLVNYGSSNDEQAMIENVLLMGCEMEQEGNKLFVKKRVNSQFSTKYNVSESGLGLRLMTAILATKSTEIQIEGQGSLLQREHRFFGETLPQMGGTFISNSNKLPFQIEGPLQPGNYIVDGAQSSQYISGLLIAFSQVDGTTKLQVKDLNSRPYVDMTLHTLHAFGIQILEPERNTFVISGKQIPYVESYTIDGDWSSASCLLVASALGLDIKIKGLSMQSKQADKMLVSALMQAGCRFFNSEHGMYFDGKQRQTLHFDATHCPDLFPALAVYAALTPGEHKISGLQRLANKESNRGLTLQTELEKMGADVHLCDDQMIIKGKTKLKSAKLSAHNDHRIAMCLTIAAMVSQIEIQLTGSDSVAKSYPTFYQDLKKIEVHL